MAHKVLLVNPRPRPRKKAKKRVAKKRVAKKRVAKKRVAKKRVAKKRTTSNKKRVTKKRTTKASPISTIKKAQREFDEAKVKYARARLVGTTRQRSVTRNSLRAKSRKVHDKQLRHGVLRNPTNNFVYAIVQDPNDKSQYHTMAITGQVVMNIGMEYLGTESSLSDAKKHIQKYADKNYGPIFNISSDRKLTRVRA